MEYAYNNIVHSSTGKAPFEIVEGGCKVPPILQTKDKIFEDDKFVESLDVSYQKVKRALHHSKKKHKKEVDRHCRDLKFKVGDYVVLCFQKAQLKVPKERLGFFQS